MSQAPPTYVPESSFSALAELPILTNGLPGAALDAEFTRMGDSVNQTIARLSEVQRDDGKLQRGIVDLASLGSEVLAIIATVGVNPRTWETGQSYAPGDLVSNPRAGLSVEGALDPDATGTLKVFWGFTSFPNFSSTDSFDDLPASAICTTCYYSVNRWFLTHYPTGTNGPAARWQSAITSVESPDLATGWVPIDGDLDATGTPEFEWPATYAFGTYLCLQSHIASGAGFNDDAPKWALIAAPPVAGVLVVDEFTGDGVTTAFVLSDEPVTKSNTQIYVNGVYVAKDAYSLSGSSILFGVAPANLALIEVVSGIPAQTAIVTVTDAAITAAKLAGGAVTEEKLANSAVTTDKLGAGSVTTPKLADGAVTADKIANFAVTDDKIGAGAVTAGKLAASAVASGNIATGAVTGDKIANGSITPAKLPAGALSLNGEPTLPAHATTKSYADTKADAAANAVSIALGASKVSKAGDTMTGPLTMGTAPLPVPAGTAPLYGARAYARATPYFGGSLAGAYKTGTYVRDGAGLLTVTITAHGLNTNNAVYLLFTGTATDGLHVVTKINDNVFTIPQAGVAIASAAVTAYLYRIASAANISSVTTADGGPDRLVWNFTVPMPNADYAITGTIAESGAAVSYGLCEMTNAGAQLNTIYQGFTYGHGNATTPRFVSVAIFG